MNASTDGVEPKVAIVGAGAIGGHLAVRLAGAGARVSVVARGSTLEAIRRDGLVLECAGAAVATRPDASDDASVLGVQDVVFVTVKATALASIASSLEPLVGPATRVVFAQNGMAWWYPIALPAAHPSLPPLVPFALAARFQAFLDPAQVVGAVVYSANQVVAPGRVRNDSPGRNALEIASPADAADPAVDALRALLTRANVASPPVADLRASLWLKLIGNAASSPLAIAVGDTNAIVADARVRETFGRIVDELLAVARAYGHDLVDRFDVDRWTRHRTNHKPSMVVDFERGRPMEIDEIVLAPALLARHAGVAVPTFDAVAAIVARRAAAAGSYGTTARN